MVRDLVTIQNASPIPLDGIGIVTGLAGTGDKSEAAISLLRSYMQKMNTSFDVSSLERGSVALVKVTAELPPFIRPGQKFPVIVTSISGAKSLSGGELLSCDLVSGRTDPRTGKREVMARASGHVQVGTDPTTRGVIPAGENAGALAVVPFPITKVINDEGWLRLNINRANWADANSIARQINQTPSLNPNLREVSMFAESEDVKPVAYARDAGQVIVMVPEQYRYDITRYVAGILEVQVSLDRPATIVINRSRNSIVVTGDVRVGNAMVSLQDKTVTLRPETPDEPAAYTLDNETPRRLVEIEGPGSYADLESLIDTLNAMGLNTDQIITIFQQLRTAGAITANLVIE